ncbi:hypothetical protein ACFQUU_13710 [Herbaspirillum sp. GCM10030257]|uniref:hypothetical protein n=1 Tax=Herbaspirillum sp. GCM10030257 TaxID=3273393 RepID=UPI0036186FC3
MDLKKGGRRALHAILAFYNLKTKAAIFPYREALAHEASVSVQTIQRDLAELEAREYIIRQPQKHKSAAAGPNAGRFWIAPIVLTQKALVLLGLQEVIHRPPSLKMRDGIYSDIEHTKEVQSSSKNSIPSRSRSDKLPKQSDDVDPATRLPKDLVHLLERGVSKSGIFLLMKIARAHGKRLSDIVTYRMPRIDTLALQGRALFSYLRDLTVANIDFAHLAQQARVQQDDDEKLSEAKALQQRLHRHCDGYEVCNENGVIGIFRASVNIEECGRIEMEGGSRPLNIRTALALLRSGVRFRRPEAYFC